jgi:hypothetical protein
MQRFQKKKKLKKNNFRFWEDVGVEEVLLIAGGEADGFGSRSSVEAFDGVNWKLVMKE